MADQEQLRSARKETPQHWVVQLASTTWRPACHIQWRSVTCLLPSFRASLGVMKGICKQFKFSSIQVKIFLKVIKVPNWNADSEVLHSLVSWMEKGILLWPGGSIRQPLRSSERWRFFSFLGYQSGYSISFNLLLCDPIVLLHMAAHCNSGVIALLKLSVDWSISATRLWAAWEQVPYLTHLCISHIQDVKGT